MEQVFCLLDNTFIGTLLAGLFLAWAGLHLYRKQKKLDIEYDDLRQLRQVAALLFASTEVALRKYEAQLNLHSGKSSTLQNLYNAVNQKTNNYLSDEFEKDFRQIQATIVSHSDDLIARLKIKGGSNVEREVLLEKIPIFNFFLITATSLHLSKPEDIETYRVEIKKVYQAIETALQLLIKMG